SAALFPKHCRLTHGVSRRLPTKLSKIETVREVNTSTIFISYRRGEGRDSKSLLLAAPFTTAWTLLIPRRKLAAVAGDEAGEFANVDRIVDPPHRAVAHAEVGAARVEGVRLA